LKTKIIQKKEKMKSKIHLITTALFFVFVLSCNTKQKITSKKAIAPGDNSLTSVDWPGIYQGVLPCADCEGIQIQLHLNGDLNYILETRYIGKDEKVIESKGSFKWDKSGSKITLDNSENQMYQVGENRLFHLDKSGNRITGDFADKYILEKEKIEITGKYWKLIELNGQPVKLENREPFILLNKTGNSVTGNSSCNSFNGNYEITEGNKIKFSPFAMTRMACINNKTENEFMKVLEATTNYYLPANNMVLLDSSNKELAKFEADFFK
jgi:heat shock protein HslJ